MENFVGFVILLAVVAIVAGSSESEEPKTERERAVIAAIHGQRFVRHVRQSRTFTATTSTTSGHGRPIHMTSSASSEQVIRQAARAFDVPAGQPALWSLDRGVRQARVTLRKRRWLAHSCATGTWWCMRRQVSQGQAALRRNASHPARHLRAT